MSKRRDIAAGIFIAFFSTFNAALADPPTVLRLQADLEMKDFHDSTILPGPLRVGEPVTLTFKNNTVVKLVPLSADEKNIKLKTLILGVGGGTLYNATFATHYNTDAELSEKRPDGDLVYHLKINPQTDPPAQK